MFQKIFLLALVVLQSACTQPTTSAQFTSEGIRPGLEDNFDYASMSPVLGKVGRWTLLQNGVESSSISLEISRRADGLFEHRGTRQALSNSARNSELYALTDNARRSVLVRTNEQTITYEPHDCTNMLGQCRTVRTVTRPDGAVDEQHLIVQSSVSGGVWHKVMRFDPTSDPDGRSGVFVESYYSNAADGFFIDVRSVSASARRLEWRREDL